MPGARRAGRLPGMNLHPTRILVAAGAGGGGAARPPPAPAGPHT